MSKLNGGVSKFMDDVMERMDGGKRKKRSGRRSGRRSGTRSSDHSTTRLVLYRDPYLEDERDYLRTVGKKVLYNKLVSRPKAIVTTTKPKKVVSNTGTIQESNISVS